MCEQKIEKLKEELRELIKQAEKFLNKENKQEYKRWRAETNKGYYLIDSYNDVIQNSDIGCNVDNSRYEMGNYFKTREEAEEYKENLITKQKLKDLALRLNEGVEIDWDNPDQCKYYIFFHHEANYLDLDYYVSYQHLGTIHCLNKNFLNVAKEEIGKEALIKLIKSGV